MAAGEAAGAIELLQTTLDGPVDPEQAMRGLVTHLRYVCLLQQGARPRDEWAFAPEEIARLQAQANQLSDAQVVRALDLLADAQVRIRHGGADPRLQLELVAARLSRPALDAGAAALDGPRRGPRGGPPGPARRRSPPPPEPAMPWRCRPRRRPSPRSPRRPSRPTSPPRPISTISRASGPLVLDLLEREAPPTRGFLDGSRPTAVDEGSLEVTVTSAMRAEMLGGSEHRERVAEAVASVAGRRMEIRFVAGAPVPHDPGPEEPPEPRDDETLLEEFKTMFRAVEEDGERTEQGGPRWPKG